MGDCQTFHYDSARLGVGDGAAAGTAWSKRISVNLGSAVRGAPLCLQGWIFQEGPHTGETHNMVYIATSDNHVKAYAEDHLLAGSSTPIWSVSLGPPVMRTGSNIPPPIGVAGTPVLDPANSRMFVCSYQVSGTNSIYMMFALDLDTGATIQSAPLTDPGAAGRPTFDPNLQDQRGGLNLVGGRVFATFAAFFAYDIGNYHGWVVACNPNNLNNQWYFSTTKNVLAGGCWGPGGAAAAPDGTLYIATGNATTADNAYWAGLPAGQHPGDVADYFIAIVKLGVVSAGYAGHLVALDWYQPTNARSLNDADLDLGSSSCMVLPDIAGMQMVVVSAKNDIYLLNRNNLGHWGGELWTAHVFGGESHSAPAYCLTPSGDHYVYFSGGGAPGLICYKVVVSAGTASLQEVWRAAGTGVAFDEGCSSPTVGRVTSPSAYALIWVADGGSTPVLHAYNALDGSEVYSSATVAADDLGAVPHYPPVTCAGPSVYVGTQSGFALYHVKIHKIWKDLKPEIKEHKDFKIEKIEKIEKYELKENLKAEVDVKQIFEGPKLKDAEGAPRQRFGDDVTTLIQALAARVDELGQQLAEARAFIRPEERPPVGEEPLRRDVDRESRKPK